MKRRLLSLFLSIMMLASIVGGILPAASASAASATGQTFFLSYNDEIVTEPEDVVSGVIQLHGEGILTFGSYPIVATGDVDYVAGAWMGQLTLNEEFNGAVTLSIAHADHSAGTVHHGSQNLNVASPTQTINFSIPADSFTIPANNGGQILFIISGMDVMSDLYINAIGSAFSAPYGSDIFPSGEPQGDDSGGTPSGEPAWPSTPTFSDTTGDASGAPDITGIDYLVDETDVYIRFIAAADFSFYNQTIAVALDIDGNPATGSPDDSYGPVGSDYKIMSGYTEGTYSGTTFEKYGSPSPIDGVLFTDAVSSVPRYFFFTIPLSVLGVDAAEFQDGVKINAVISSPGSSYPVILDEITGQNEDSGGSSGDDTPSEPAWPSTPFVEDDDNDAEGVFEITKVDYLSDSSYIYVRVSAGGTIRYTNLISRTYFDIDQSTSTGCNNAMTAPLGSDYYVDITWDSVGTPSADVKKWDSTNGNWALAVFDISFVKSATSYWFAVTAASFGTDFSEFATGLFFEQQIIDMNGGNISDVATNFAGSDSGLPDLAITDVEVTWSSGNYEVTFTIVNNGSVASTDCEVHYSVDSEFYSPLYLTDLAPVGGSNTMSFTTVPIYFLEESNTVDIFVDYYDEVTESNEDNNTETITVVPEPVTFTLTIAANPPAGGTTVPAAGAHTYDSGTVVTINATPNVGYDFVNWIGDVASPTSLQTTVTMNEDKTVTANFQEAQLPQSDAWTVMVYMAADNDLEPDMLEDLNEMEVAGSSDKVNIVALFDGYGPANTNAYLIEKDPDGLDAILVSEPWVPYSGWSWDLTDEANMGDPGTLLEFIHKTVGEFPATHYALIFSNHGNGWRAADTTQSLPLKGVCTDVTDSDDYLTIAEISGALATITTGDSPLLSDGFGIIGFDACMMQMTEVAYELKDYGWFMVGSEETEQGDGWPYDAVFSEFVPANDTAPVMCRDFADMIVSNYGEYYTSVAVDTYHTLSAVELKPSMSGGMDGLAAALDNFVRTIMSYNDYSTVDNASFNVDCFYDDTYIDLLDFVDQVRKTTPYTAVAEAAVAVKIVLVGDET
ncbi:MAG: hypothetical protein GX631_10535, partial [Dehalococcoidales bacterium]|nr:hypothetical protein [Dehalococcoidales bacterium]